MAVALSGGSSTTLAMGNSPFAVAVDATNVYWVDYGGGTVMKIAKP